MTRPIDLAAQQRLHAIADLLAAGQRITTAEIRTRFGVSPATAKRDLARIEDALPTSCTIGPNRRVVLEIAKP